VKEENTVINRAFGRSIEIQKHFVVL